MMNVDNTDNAGISEYASPISLFYPSSRSMLFMYFEESFMQIF